jgi:hypothetical protein
MPANGLDLGRPDGILKRERVAIVDALAAPLKYEIAVSGSVFRT